MRTKIYLSTVIFLMIMSCNPKQEKSPAEIFIGKETVDAAIKNLVAKYGKEHSNRIERGVKHISVLWREPDGNKESFSRFCIDNFIADEEELDKVFQRVSRNLEILSGSFNKISLQLQEPLQLNTYEMLPIDQIFGGYDAGAHLTEDFYRNKLAFMIALNFPYYTLKEKEELGSSWSRKQWAYARVGDLFDARVPAELNQEIAMTLSDADVYISAYNIYMGSVIDEEGEKLFGADKILLSHWNLRDELKANYADKSTGLDKQKTIYQVMKRIITQEIPEKVINSRKYDWDPFRNVVYLNGEETGLAAEPNTRYEQIIKAFRTYKKIDQYEPYLDTYIKRNFDADMEMTLESVEALFVGFLESPLLIEVGKHISSRLGRDLQPFDIWYDGFKARSNLDEKKLDAITQNKYSTPAAFEADMDNILVKLGFETGKAREIASQIVVDPARGSGHAWGAQMKSAKAHLRTRIPEDGMDYKGYNIAIHEFGHNVEQTISLHDVDYYVLNGVPNTAFTEALAFVFQKRDLELLGIDNNNPEKEDLRILDLLWSTYEICGVSLLDIGVWKWLYANPDADAAALKAEVIRLAKEIWNTYYAPVYGMEDEIILAIYSHMISYPLYLSAYAVGNLIEFQLEQHLLNNDFAEEVERIFSLGRLTPNEWMKEATGTEISVQPLLEKAELALDSL